MRKVLPYILLTCTLGFLNIYHSVAQSDYKVSEQDSLALVAFYWATDGPNWISNQDGFSRASLSSDWQVSYNRGFSKWLQGPVKDWYGIYVEKRPVRSSTDSVYRVVEMAPILGRRSDGENHMKGYIPDEVGLLTEVRIFRVNGNLGLAGTELTDKAFISTVKYFDVEGCRMEGDLKDGLRNCTKAQTLNIRYNNFSYMPSLDFMPESTLRLPINYWLYSCQFPLSIFEKIVDYFYTISPNPKEFFVEFRDNTNVGDEVEVVAPLGSNVELVCNSAGEKAEFITYQWFRNGLSRFGKTSKTYAISGVKSTDYGDYTVKITNDYVKSYDQNSNWGEVYTKAIHLVPEPVSPVLKWAKTSYNGQEIQLRFSKRMNQTVAGFEQLEVKANGVVKPILSAKTSGRLNNDLIVTLSDPIVTGESITVSLKDMGITDKNGGVLQLFSDSSVQNMVRPAPEFVSATTTKDGAFIEVTFSRFVDPALLSGGTWLVTGTKEHIVTGVQAKNGLIDNGITKTIRLILQTPVDDPDEVLLLGYSGGRVAGLYGGTVMAFENKPIENVIVVDNTNVLLSFIDGTKKLKNILIAGSWGSEPIQMFDDATKGDVTANDHIWSRIIPLVDDTYSWDVLSRTSYTDRDTIRTIDPETGIETLTIIPFQVNNDSVLNNSKFLQFQVINKKTVGDTTFGINNQTVMFNLSLQNPVGDVYLMGIKDDWGIGSPMSFNGTYFQDTIEGYSAGDVIRYNFRSGDQWENLTPTPRVYVVQEGVNLVVNQFGVFTALNSFNATQNQIYFNKTTASIIVKGEFGGSHLSVYNLMGQLVRSVNLTDEKTSSIPVSFGKGIYLVFIKSGLNNVLTKKLIIN